MKKRVKLTRSGSRRLFSKTASRSHIKNSNNIRPMRGGIRL